MTRQLQTNSVEIFLPVKGHFHPTKA